MDLHPIRAGIATTPETSDFTSVQDRILDRHSEAEVSPSDAQDQRIEHRENAGWLANVALGPPRKKVREKQSSRRGSSKGCLQLTLDAYPKLLDWTGRQHRKDKAGKILSNLAKPNPRFPMQR